jgi:hypothetical protein
MIDIVQTLRDQHPDLGPYVVALREPTRVVEDGEPLRLTPEARGWLDRHAPGARVVRREVRLPGPDGEPRTRALAVAAFASARELAAFALEWT